MPELKPYQTAIIELVCLSSFGLEIFLKARFMGTKSLTSSGWHVLQVCLICLDFGNLLLVLITDEFHVGLGLIVRPLLFVAKSRSVRGGFTILIRTLPAFADVLVLLICVILFGAGVGCVLFQDSEEGT
jgi:hypothetical protein